MLRKLSWSVLYERFCILAPRKCGHYDHNPYNKKRLSFSNEQSTIICVVTLGGATCDVLSEQFNYEMQIACQLFHSLFVTYACSKYTIEHHLSNFKLFSGMIY